MDRCRLQGASGDALHALSCALGYNIRWLMRALQAKARKALSCLLRFAAARGELNTAALHVSLLQLLAMLRDQSRDRAGSVVGSVGIAFVG